MRFVLLLAGLLGLFSLAAEARMHTPYRGHRIVQGVAPLDAIASAPAAAYSMRRLKSTYTGPAIRLRRASDNAEQDINFLGFTSFTGSPIDTAAANAFCAATTCFLSAWYDQGGASRHLVMAVTANQPQYIADCGNGRPCARSANGQNVQFPTITPAGAQSFSAVARVDGAAQTCVFANAGNNRLISSTGATWISDNGAGAQVEAAAPLGAWHAGSSVLNGGASGIIVDNGTEVTGTVAVAATVGTLYAIYDPGANPCSQSEMVYWNGYGLTQPERAALSQNQRNFWGF